MNKDKDSVSIYDSLYWLIEDKKLDPRVFFDFLGLFWPDFVVVDGSVFLKEKYSSEEKSRLIDQGTNPEYWINLLTIDDYFADAADHFGLSSRLVKALTEMWQVKLEKEFPTRYFTVECFLDDETGDCGLTFYQKSVS